MSVEQDNTVDEGLFPSSMNPEEQRVAMEAQPGYHGGTTQPMGVVGHEPEPQPEAGPAQPMPARDEIERLDPQPIEMKLASGTEFDLEPLKLRQFLRLLRIVTRGAADVLDTANLDFENPQDFLQTFLGMVLFSIPEAEEETVAFIQSMVRPKHMTGNPEKDLIKVRELVRELDNPELEDTLTIVQSIIERESEDLRALGKRLGSMLRVAEKMGATKPDPSPTNKPV
jgi:hypothetical protein